MNIASENNIQNEKAQQPISRHQLIMQTMSFSQE
jgi:hypothetical protein